MLEKFECEDICILGDFNVIVDRKKDKKTTKAKGKGKATLIQELFGAW